MPLIVDPPFLKVADKSASPGFSYGRPGEVINAVTSLLRPGGTPSSVTGVNFGLENGSLDTIATGTKTLDTYTLTVHQHDGDFINATVIAVVTITASRKEVLVKDVDFVQVGTLVKNRHVSVELSTGTANNIGVDLQFSGNAT